MEKGKNPIIAKEANDLETASDSLYSLCQELAAVSPMCFAMAVHSYIIENCKMLIELDDESSMSKVNSRMLAIHLRSSELDIRDQFTIHSKYVANQFGIKADTLNFGDDECGF